MDGPQIDRGEVERQVAHIKAAMPKTYAAIQAKAKDVGREAFALVRRGLAGTPNQFYAFERGHVVGTPFKADHPINVAVAALMVQFGAGFLVIWPAPDGEQPMQVHDGKA